MPLNEENSRIVVLGCILALYVVVGAVIIRKFEHPFEKRLLRNYWKMYEEFGDKLINGTAQIDELNSLLYAYGNVTSSLGVPGKHERWNFLGSLYFVVTIVSTIGYGTYTPNTVAGKIFVICYGLVGCASGILFFNLFLERAITFLAYFLRELYIRKIITRSDDEEGNSGELPENWKPSIYSVLACLLICSTIMICLAVPVYSLIEGWTYVESAYFCFVSFATIGFGDFVAAQKPEYKHGTLYVFANVAVLALGCCFLYSLFNVISIVLKQLLNWLIFRLNAIIAFFHREKTSRQPERVLRKYSLKMQRERRNQRRRSSIAIIRRTLKRKALGASTPERVNDGDLPIDDRTASGLAIDRKLSDDGLISMKDFFSSNQVSLAIMQKQLQDSAQTVDFGSSRSIEEPITYEQEPPERSKPATSVPAIVKSSFPAGRFIPGTIGPLAILCDKLGDK
ncbi:potassium channel subfamily K member 13-like [Planococcus citri]|uniref:potassium channel subfamily K member 13-like n=1 Tax=Planococcus citri TaxID=170843 RepID=UPI0031F74518